MYQFNKSVIKLFNEIKTNCSVLGNDFFIPVLDNGVVVAKLIPVTNRHLFSNDKNNELLDLFMRWRASASGIGFDIFLVTFEGTKKWLREQVIDKPDRLLFILETIDGIPFGHMGFYRGEADNFIRGKDLVKGGMTLALKAMLQWAFNVAGIKELYLRVFADNQKAIKLYERCGFKVIDRIPLKKEVRDNTIKWEEMKKMDKTPIDRYFNLMYLTNVKEGKK